MNNYEEMISELKDALEKQGYSQEQINEIQKTYFNQSTMNDYYYDGLQFKVNLPFVNESDNPDPQFNKNGDAGFDLRADITNEENTYYDDDGDLALNIKPNELKMIGTGLYFGLPNSYEMQIRPRSGLVAKHKVTVANSPGTVDCVPEGTKISTPNGYKNIEEIFEEEKTIIYSYNEEENIIEEDVVDDMWLVENLELIEITTEDDDVVRIPITKEIYTNNGWKLAGNLTEEDEILRFT